MLDTADHTRPAHPRQEIHAPLDTILDRIGPAYGRLFTEEEYQALRRHLLDLGWGEPRAYRQQETLYHEWARAGGVCLCMYGYQCWQEDGTCATWWRRAA